MVGKLIQYPTRPYKNIESVIKRLAYRVDRVGHGGAKLIENDDTDVGLGSHFVNALPDAP